MMSYRCDDLKKMPCTHFPTTSVIVECDLIEKKDVLLLLLFISLSHMTQNHQTADRLVVRPTECVYSA